MIAINGYRTSGEIIDTRTLACGRARRAERHNNLSCRHGYRLSAAKANAAIPAMTDRVMLPPLR